MTEADAKKLEEQAAPIPPNPVAQIAATIDRLIHDARDVRLAARVCTAAAASYLLDEKLKVLEGLAEAVTSLGSTDSEERSNGIKHAIQTRRTSDRLQHTRLSETLSSSLFVQLFSLFDVFTGNLLRAFYSAKPALFSSIDRSIPFSDILQAASFRDLQDAVLDSEIEGIRRKSYIEQFEYFETKFSISLRKFSRWMDFVECSQRRNLYTHCGGIVSAQYRKICASQGYPDDKLPPIGTKLTLDTNYLVNACELIIEVAFKLGQTLWRKVLPENLQEADIHLRDTQYLALEAEMWDRARTIGKFGVDQKKWSTEVLRNMIAFNYAISLKFGSQEKEARSLVEVIDVSASAPAFKLAKAVLLDDFKAAKEIMIGCGKNDELVQEEAYHIWPLFKEFRGSPEFLSAYQEIYGYQFSSTLRARADETIVDLKASVQKARETVAVAEKQMRDSAAGLSEHTLSSESLRAEKANELPIVTNS